MENKITVEIFAEEVSKAFTSKGYKCELRKVKKNNGVEFIALIIKEDGSNIAPTIYLEKFYVEYEEGRNFDDVVSDIERMYQKSRVNGNAFNVDFFRNWEEVKSRLLMKLINKSANEEFLSNKPFCVFGDLAVVFQVSVSDELLGSGTITVEDGHMKEWGVTTRDLYEAAMANPQDVTIETLFSVISGMGVIPDEEAMKEGPQIYVASNPGRVNGAISLIRSDKLKDFADKVDSSFYIIPSSVHELLFVPQSEKISPLALDAMVNEVNTTTVATEEILSDHVYFYDRDEEKLLLSPDGEVMELVVA